MDPQLVLFRRQYLQLFEPDFLTWPPKQLLRIADVQAWLYNNLFNEEVWPRLPPERYQLRVLKPLIAKIEQSFEDPEEDVISDDLMFRLSTLISSELPSETTAVQQPSYVTFSCIPSSELSSGIIDKEPTLTLLEKRNLLSGSSSTGFRTWEAALHLSSYLLTPQRSSIIQSKVVLELGAGTGFMSMLCAKYLGARHVTSTDGSEEVIEALKENLFLNGLDEESQVNASILRWGHGLKGTWVEDECETWPYDVVLGADITYDSRSAFALVATIRMLFDLRPDLQVLIAGAVRNAETFEKFRHACLRNNFDVQDVDFEAKPIREQRAMFYTAAFPFKIVSITSQRPPA